MLGVNSFELEGLDMSLDLLVGKSYNFHGVQKDHVKLLDTLEKRYMRKNAIPQDPSYDAPGSAYLHTGKFGFGKSVYIVLKPELEGLEGTEEYVKILGGLEGIALFLLGQRKAFGKHIAKVFDVSAVNIPNYSEIIDAPLVYQNLGSIVSLKNRGMNLEGEFSKETCNGTSHYWAMECLKDAGISLL